MNKKPLSFGVSSTARSFRVLFAGLVVALVCSVYFPVQAQTVFGGTPPERKAIQNGDYDTLRSLLLRGLNPNDANLDGFTLLIDAARVQQLDIIELLVEQRAGLEIGDKSGNTPLHWAAGEGAYDSIELLIELGANVNAQNRRGETPLVSAIRKDDTIAVEILLAAGPDLSVRDYTGKSIIGYARDARDRRIENMLLQAGATD